MLWRTLSLIERPSISARIFCRGGHMSPIQTLGEGLTHHAPLFRYVRDSHIAAFEGPLHHPNRTYARQLPRRSWGQMSFPSRDEEEGRGRIPDTFFQMSQVCFQLRERCPELEEQAVSPVLTQHQHHTNLIAGPLELLIAVPCSTSYS